MSERIAVRKLKDKKARERLDSYTERIISHRKEVERLVLAQRRASRKHMKRASGTAILDRHVKALTLKQSVQTNAFNKISEAYPGLESYESRALMLKSVESYVDTRTPILAEQNRIEWATNDIFIKNGLGGFLPVNFGPFKIEILQQISGGARSLDCTFTPLQPNKRSNYAHPHIRDDNVPCLGNVNAMLLEHMCNNDVALIVCLVIDFLQTYNKQSPYVKLSTWVDNIWESPVCAHCSEVYINCDCERCIGCGADLYSNKVHIMNCGVCSSCCLTNHRCLKTPGIRTKTGSFTGHITNMEMKTMRELQPSRE